MAGKVKLPRQPVNLPIPDVPPGSANDKAGVKSAEIVPPTTLRGWLLRVLDGLRRRHDPSVRSRTVRVNPPAEVSDTAQAIFALYRARGYTRALPRNESFGAELPARLRMGVERTARRILRAAKGGDHRRH